MNQTTQSDLDAVSIVAYQCTRCRHHDARLGWPFNMQLFCPILQGCCTGNITPEFIYGNDERPYCTHFKKRKGSWLIEAYRDYRSDGHGRLRSLLTAVYEVIPKYRKLYLVKKDHHNLGQSYQITGILPGYSINTNRK